jgi:hypothetical protein
MEQWQSTELGVGRRDDNRKEYYLSSYLQKLVVTHDALARRATAMPSAGTGAMLCRRPQTYSTANPAPENRGYITPDTPARLQCCGVD